MVVAMAVAAHAGLTLFASRFLATNARMIVAVLVA